jgi:hypothetical protein
MYIYNVHERVIENSFIYSDNGPVIIYYEFKSIKLILFFDFHSLEVCVREKLKLKKLFFNYLQ